MTMMVDGGIMMPSVPPPATTPAASRSEYPNFFIDGYATFAKVAAVAIDEPQMPPNPADAHTVAIASPPRRWPMKAYAARNSSRDMPARVTKLPIRMKSGTTESVQLRPVAHSLLWAMANAIVRFQSRMYA